MDVVAPATTPSPKGRLFGSRSALRGWSIANLVANCLIIVTGAVVRLTDSGLGCPTWPHCEAGSFVPQGAMGHHGLIEFGNRTLTFVLMAIALATVVTAIRLRVDQRIKLLAWLIFVGIPFQGVIGGITVLTHLNPWVVALHLLLSVLLIVWCVRLVQLVVGLEQVAVEPMHRTLVNVLFWVLMLAVWLGTVVTGAGPNAGDHGSKRNNLDIEAVAKTHAWTVWVAVALTITLVVLFRRAGNAQALKWTLLVLGAELVQGMIGYAQYFTGLPTALVICHMVGIGLVVTAASWLWYGTRRGIPAS